jgi:hypothetical protein
MPAEAEVKQGAPRPTRRSKTRTVEAVCRELRLQRARRQVDLVLARPARKRPGRAV